jgi:hypothetical protein
MKTKHEVVRNVFDRCACTNDQPYDFLWAVELFINYIYNKKLMRSANEMQLEDASYAMVQALKPYVNEAFEEGGHSNENRTT